MKSNITLQIQERERPKLLSQLKLIKKPWGKNSFCFFGIWKHLRVHLYNNNKMLVQGEVSDIEQFIKKFNFKTVLNPKKIIKSNANSDTLIPSNSSLNQKKIIKTNPQWPLFGGDESGVGDLLGPIVITIVYFDQKMAKTMQNLPLKDSKKLTDQQIQTVAPQIMQFNNNFVTKIINNKTFNAQFKHKMNLKELITFHYVQTIKKIYHLDNKAPIVVDGYTKSYLFTRYCQNMHLTTPFVVQLIEKAEDQYSAVAAASIISRFVFLQEIARIEKQYHIKIQLGAGHKAKALVQNLKKTHSPETLVNILKWAYKI